MHLVWYTKCDKQTETKYILMPLNKGLNRKTYTFYIDIKYLVLLIINFQLILYI